MTGEVIPLDLMAASKGRVGITRRFPIGPIAGDQPVQLPAQPGGAQDGAGDRVGLPDRAQAAVQGPADRCSTVAEIIDAAGVPEGIGQHPADDPRAGRPDGRRRAVQAAHLHRQPVGRLADEGAGGQEEGRPRARRQRRRDRRQDRRPRLGRASAASSAPSPTRARCASASSGCSSTRTSGTRSWTSSSPARGGAEGGRPARPDDRRRPDGRRRGRGAGPSAGSTRRVALGGKVLLGGTADGTFFAPTILTDVPVHAQVCSNEAFAPLVVAFPFRDFDDAIRQVNDSLLRPPDRRLHERPRARPGRRSTSSRSAA